MSSESRAAAAEPERGTQCAAEREIRSLVDAERRRLEAQHGLDADPVEHFRRPEERPFTAEERDRVTILFGGLTRNHELLMKAVFESCGYRCEPLPTPDQESCQVGREFGNTGQCNPAYFTIGTLIRYLQDLRARGLTKEQIVDGYVFFTAGSCGPCRFGMYESEYRLALRNAGFDGFRVMLFQQDHGIRASTEPGLKFTVDFGMGMLNVLNLGDVVNDTIHRVRPYEVVFGETDRVFAQVMDDLMSLLRDREFFEILEWSPPWLRRRLAGRKRLKDTLNTLGKIREHLSGEAVREGLRQCRDRIEGIEVDWTRCKPIVKITGEFWAQTTEGDGNFRMFEFLENEGAEVHAEPVSAWMTYLLHQARATVIQRRGLDDPHPNPSWWEFKRRLANAMRFHRKCFLLSLAERIVMSRYRSVVRAMGGLAHPLVSQEEIARLAHPFYHMLTRGGEGHLEVGKNVYYTTHHLCHMVLALKPFGCMPSSQSDGVQSGVVNRYPDMIFLPIETSGDGEVHAHSRVQMALGEARAKARSEFEQALESTGFRLEEIRDFAAEQPELRSPLCPIPHHPGVAGVAANFVLHAAERMRAGARHSAAGFGRARNHSRSRTAMLAGSARPDPGSQ